MTQTKNQKFLEAKSERNIQLISNVITKSLRIASTTIETNTEILENWNAVGVYHGKTLHGYLIELVDATDTITAIHEIIHHVQSLLYNGTDIHGRTWNLARKKVTDVINKKFGLTLASFVFE